MYGMLWLGDPLQGLAHHKQKYGKPTWLAARNRPTNLPDNIQFVENNLPYSYVLIGVPPEKAKETYE